MGGRDAAGLLQRSSSDTIVDLVMDEQHGMPTKARSVTLDEIEAALRRPLPGRPAQICMAPVPRPLDPPTPAHRPRQAGVLLLLYAVEENGELWLVLTRRTDSVADHKGQISLPGGAVNPGDSSTAQTALRETCEEIGICGDSIRMLGSLTPIYIAPSDFCIEPYVAYLPFKPALELQHAEVAEVLEVPISHFMGDVNKAVEDWLLHDPPMRVPYFDVFGHKVWGATAMVLAEFAALISDSVTKKPRV
jgi:8-oxo-dGTP pyrophosphatase MutT (NUDIX family)